MISLYYPAQSKTEEIELQQYPTVKHIMMHIDKNHKYDSLILYHEGSMINENFVLKNGQKILVILHQVQARLPDSITENQRQQFLAPRQSKIPIMQKQELQMLLRLELNEQEIAEQEKQIELLIEGINFSTYTTEKSQKSQKPTKPDQVNKDQSISAFVKGKKMVQKKKLKEDPRIKYVDDPEFEYRHWYDDNTDDAAEFLAQLRRGHLPIKKGFGDFVLRKKTKKEFDDVSLYKKKKKFRLDDYEQETFGIGNINPFQYIEESTGKPFKNEIDMERLQNILKDSDSDREIKRRRKKRRQENDEIERMKKNGDLDYDPEMKFIKDEKERKYRLESERLRKKQMEEDEKYREQDKTDTEEQEDYDFELELEKIDDEGERLKRQQEIEKYKKERKKKKQKMKEKKFREEYLLELQKKEERIRAVQFRKVEFAGIQTNIPAVTGLRKKEDQISMSKEDLRKLVPQSLPLLEDFVGETGQDPVENMIKEIDKIIEEGKKEGRKHRMIKAKPEDFYKYLEEHKQRLEKIAEFEKEMHDKVMMMAEPQMAPLEMMSHSSMAMKPIMHTDSHQQEYFQEPLMSQHHELIQHQPIQSSGQIDQMHQGQEQFEQYEEPAQYDPGQQQLPESDEPEQLNDDDLAAIEQIVQITGCDESKAKESYIIYGKNQEAAVNSIFESAA